MVDRIPKTSLGSRRKFSVERTQRLTAGIDSSAHQRSTSSSFRAPSAYAWHGSTKPRSSAYRRLPSGVGPGGRGAGRPPNCRRRRRSQREERDGSINPPPMHATTPPRRPSSEQARGGGA